MGNPAVHPLLQKVLDQLTQNNGCLPDIPAPQPVTRRCLDVKALMESRLDRFEIQRQLEEAICTFCPSAEEAGEMIQAFESVIASRYGFDGQHANRLLRAYRKELEVIYDKNSV